MSIKSIPYDALKVGREHVARRVCAADDALAVSHACGALVAPSFDADAPPTGWGVSMLAAIIESVLPGPGTAILSQAISHHAKARVGEVVSGRVLVLAKEPERMVRLALELTGEDSRALLSGEAMVRAPADAIEIEGVEAPDFIVERHVHLDRLIKRAEPLDPIPTAVVAPHDAASLGGALLGRDHTLIAPILVGDPGKIRAVADEIGGDLAGIEMIEAHVASEAATAAVSLVSAGRAQALMKGKLHTDELLSAALKREAGLRTGRRLSHVFVFDVPGAEELLMVTDAAINIAPDLETKVDIIQNAIDLAHALGVETPRVGVLSAVETVTPKIPSTLDAAILSKMADRGQITGGLVDGPLAMDNAVDVEAAQTKGLKSLVAGRADILVAPNLEAGNILAKQLAYISHAEGGGLVLGARVPIILTSRADDDKARLASCAVAALHYAYGAGRAG